MDPQSPLLTGGWRVRTFRYPIASPRSESPSRTRQQPTIPPASTFSLIHLETVSTTYCASNWTAIVYISRGVNSCATREILEGDPNFIMKILLLDELSIPILDYGSQTSHFKPIASNDGDKGRQ